MNWQRQTDGPLFPDILWNQPENKRHAGKILIIGGHAQSFSAVSEAYSAANRAGIGAARVIIPNTLQKTLSKLFPEAEYAPSTNIGSFSRQAMDTFLDYAYWADGILLAGDFGKNSETAILLENFIKMYQGVLTITGDALDYFINESPRHILIDRPKTLLVGSVSQIQKLAEPKLIQQQADFMKIIEQISGWVGQIKPALITAHSNQIITAFEDRLSSTTSNIDSNTDLAPYATVWWIQQPDKLFEAICSAVYDAVSRKNKA